jgi:hypothetical protein
VKNFCKIKADGGGIYTYQESSVPTNRQIYNNVIDSGYGNNYGLGYADPTNLFEGQVHGIYLDGGVRNMNVHDNTISNTDNCGVYVNKDNRNDTITNNTIFNCKFSQLRVAYAAEGHYFKKNILVAKKSGSLAFYTEAPLINFYSDSNYFCRAIWEPDGINKGGYKIIPPTWFNYNGGGTIFSGVDGKYKSLDIWKTYSGKDANSHSTYTFITDTISKIRLLYNPTNTAMPVSLGRNTEYDVKGVAYSGTIILQPYTSIVLLKPEANLPKSFKSIFQNKTLNNYTLETIIFILSLLFFGCSITHVADLPRRQQKA